MPTTVRRTSTALVAAALLAVTGTAASTVFVASAAQAAVRFGDRTLRSGDTGSDVKALQKALTAVGIRVGADGEFGSTTKSAVLRFQRWARLEASGSVGQKTVKALTSAVSRGNNVATPSGGGVSTDYEPAPVDTPSDTAPVTDAKLGPNGTAIAPSDAPEEVQQIIAAGNKIANKPYVYGGGHGSFKASGYDCSGSVSYALHGAGLLNTQLTSGDLESWGKAGKGSWVTIYANAGHTFMQVAGLRFDTSGANPSRWQKDWRSKSGYVVRHPTGL